MLPLISLVMPIASQVLNSLDKLVNPRANGAATPSTTNIMPAPTNIYINNKISY